MQEAEVRISTRGAAFYLRDLAQVWNHTYPVRYDTLTGEVVLPHGQLIMTADEDSFVMRIIAEDQERLQELKVFSETHVRRLESDPHAFAFDWKML